MNNNKGSVSSRTNVVAFIPARAGSVRIPNKNLYKIGGQHPLIGIAIVGALKSGVFDRVILVTDDEVYADIGLSYGAEVPALRPADTAGTKSPDVDWLLWIKNLLVESENYHFETFAILRPTSPFRKPETIRKAARIFLSDGRADSLRAVSRVSEHPGKMWIRTGEFMTPILPNYREGIPWHSCQSSALPDYLVQNASLEMASTRVIDRASIAGEIIIPFETDGFEGLDINRQLDLDLVELLYKRYPELLDFMEDLSDV